MTEKQFLESLVDRLTRYDSPESPSFEVEGDIARSVGGCMAGMRPYSPRAVYHLWLKHMTTDWNLLCSD
jgi:hypothetical protein